MNCLVKCTEGATNLFIVGGGPTSQNVSLNKANKRWKKGCVGKCIVHHMTARAKSIADMPFRLVSGSLNLVEGICTGVGVLPFSLCLVCMENGSATLKMGWVQAYFGMKSIGVGLYDVGGFIAPELLVHAGGKALHKSMIKTFICHEKLKAESDRKPIPEMEYYSDINRIKFTDCYNSDSSDSSD